MRAHVMEDRIKVTIRPEDSNGPLILSEMSTFFRSTRISSRSHKDYIKVKICKFIAYRRVKLHGKCDLILTVTFELCHAARTHGDGDRFII